MRKALEERLIRFASDIILMKKYIIPNFEGDHLAKQMVRSGTSVALNYAEALGAQTKKDFIHKQGIVMKELRETWVNLQIIKQSNLCRDHALLQVILEENHQLIKIFTKTLQTLRNKEPIQ